MKILNAIAAAGLLLSSATVATAAQAQNYDRDHSQYDRDHRGDRDDNRGNWDRHDNDRHAGWDHGRHNGWNNHRRCWTEWRHHRQVRICR
ncbi:MAG: hypothetical protein ABIS14_14680 [Sphingomonas sp.]